MKNEDKIILDLCGGTGSWAKPYKEVGYHVITITLPEFDITKTIISNGTFHDGKKSFYFKGQTENYLKVPFENVYGILAAPPCTMFSFARTNAKSPRDLREGMKCVRACLEIIWVINEVVQNTGKKTLPLKFWALENPHKGFLTKFLGKPAFVFNPYHFGDMYQKETAIWGDFNLPEKTHTITDETFSKFDYLKSKDIHPEYFGKFDRQTRRSITPQGFAKSFFKENQ